MALWTPSETVGPNEGIGRRLFERQKLRGAQDQNARAKVFELYHFEETRGNGEVSVDRSGRNGIDPKVCNYVEVRAAAAAAKFQTATPFSGWAAVGAKELQKPSKGPVSRVISSPEVARDGGDLSHNKFHAHVERPTNYEVYEMALHLKYIFEKRYQFKEASQRCQATTPVTAPMRLWEWVCKVFARKP